MYLSEVELKMDLMVTSKLEVWRVPKMIATFSKGEGGGSLLKLTQKLKRTTEKQLKVSVHKDH